MVLTPAVPLRLAVAPAATLSVPMAAAPLMVALALAPMVTVPSTVNELAKSFRLKLVLLKNPGAVVVFSPGLQTHGPLMPEPSA